ncbi:MAG: hypothetical protein ACLQBJ_12490 [Bryobacteraceae bacterium]
MKNSELDHTRSRTVGAIAALRAEGLAKTYKRYVHPQAHTILAAMERAHEVQRGTRIGHTDENGLNETAENSAAIN